MTASRTAPEDAAGAPPAVDEEDARAGLLRRIAASTTRVVVLDDDPTGSQGVHGVPVLTAWAPDDVRWAFAQPGGGFFVLTNTRSLGEERAGARLAEVVDVVEAVAAERGERVSFVSRSDSTLRGHFPLETDVLAERAAASGAPVDVLLLVPAYPAAGRITVGGVHLVGAEGEWRPVGSTGYAADATFGFTSSDLADWVAERTGGRVPADAVRRLGLDDVRFGGAERVRDVLLADGPSPAVVADAAAQSDLDVIAAGLLDAERAGRRVLVRSGPSFAAARLGVVPRPPLGAGEIPVPVGGGRHGLVVAGSHVELTTRQLARLAAERPEVRRVELDVERVLAAEHREDEVRRAAAALIEALQHADALLATSRLRVDGGDPQASLAIARAVSAAVVDAVSRVRAAATPAWVVAKGGITSSDVATEALGIRRAVVAGQLLPGIVSVWSDRTVDGVEAPPYVVFAGNVGDDDALAAVVGRLQTAVAERGADAD